MSKITDKPTECQACLMYQNEGVADYCPEHSHCPTCGQELPSKYADFFTECMSRIWSQDGIGEALKYAKEAL